MTKKLIMTLTLSLLFAHLSWGEGVWELGGSNVVNGGGGRGGNGDWLTTVYRSNDLFKRIAETGNEAHLIVYEWKDQNQSQGRRALVVYKDINGQYCGIEQRLQRTIYLTGDSPQEWVDFVSKKTNNRVLTHYADR